MKALRVVVFGKSGCDKCALLNQRLDKLLEGGEWSEFEKHYCSVDTEEGLVAFSEAECINPQRIPAMLVMHRSSESAPFAPVENPNPGDYNDICKKSELYQYIGLQTDYTAKGKGIISPRMIEHTLQKAQAAVN